MLACGRVAAAEGELRGGMTGAEYFQEVGLPQVYGDTWGWCAGVLAELEAKEEKSAADRKEIRYYKRKVDKREKYEEMELTDWMNVLKHQDLAGRPAPTSRSARSGRSRTPA